MCSYNHQRGRISWVNLLLITWGSARLTGRREIFTSKSLRALAKAPTSSFREKMQEITSVLLSVSSSRYMEPLLFRCEGKMSGNNMRLECGKIMDLSCVCKSQGSSQMQHHWDNKLSNLYSLSWSPTICMIQHVFYKSKSSIWCCCLIWGVDVIVCVLV